MAFMVLAVLAYLGCRVFVTDRFHIRTSSMEPAFFPGDRIRVNKLLFGARIYTDFKFDADGAPHCIRIPGLRRIRHNDVVVFNYPYGNDNWEKIEFKMNNVYCKRVMGMPGDTVSIVEGRYCTSGYDGPIGNIASQDMVKMLGEEYFMQTNTFYTIPSGQQSWNVLSMGPLVVPAKGLTIHIDFWNRGLYINAIEYEGGNPYGSEYCFRQNWYFLVGDNAPESVDSRFFGFVPEKFIIGIVSDIGHGD